MKKVKYVLYSFIIIIILSSTYLIIIKGHTPPIWKKGSISRFESVNIGGVKQSILIRGENIENPILLYIHGGPGTPDTAIIRKYQKEYEKYFVVVDWDQRGSGKSYNKKIDVNTLDAAHICNDAIELVKYLRLRFKRDKVYIMAHSWGTYIGMKAVSMHPEYFYAYIGMGQVADQQRNEFIIRKFAMDNAKKEGNTKAITELKTIGDPPYTRSNFEKSLSVNRRWTTYYGGFFYGKNNTNQLTTGAIFGLEYNLFDLIHYLDGENLYYKTTSKARWDLYNANLFKEVPEVKIPVYFCQGKNDYTTSYELAKEYYGVIKAPLKRFETFYKSGHYPHIEEQGKFCNYLINTVLKETYK